MVRGSKSYIERVLCYLNESVEYAIMRNYEGLPHNNASRDIDIVISRREFKRHKSEIERHILSDGWHLFSYLYNGRIRTYVCAKIEDEELCMVQWDLFEACSVHGVVLMQAKDMLATREFNGVLYHLSLDYVFLDKYLYNRVVGAEYPQKYIALRQRAESCAEVKKQLKQIFRCDDVEHIDRTSGRVLLLGALLRNMSRRPLSTLYSVLRSLYYYVSNFFKSDVAPTITFTGVDGAGKTTIINLLLSKLSPIYANATIYHHFRPHLLPNIGELAHSLGAKSGVDRCYDRPHRGAKSALLSSLLRLCYYTLDYVVGYFVKIKPQARETKVIIFDRYFSDIIVDPTRSRISLGEKFLYLWSRVFIPKMSYSILLLASVQEVLSRKRELEESEIISIQSTMKLLTKRKGYFLVYNNAPAAVAALDILSIVIEGQHRRNCKKIRYRGQKI